MSRNKETPLILKWKEEQKNSHQNKPENKPSNKSNEESNPRTTGLIELRGETLELAEEPSSSTPSDQSTKSDKENPNNNERRFFVVNKTPNSSSLTINAVVKSDANCDIKSATTSKPIQISKKIRSQCNANFIKNGDINNQFSIYHQNIRGLKGKISELQLSVPLEAPHLICLTEHHLK